MLQYDFGMLNKHLPQDMRGVDLMVKQMRYSAENLRETAETDIPEDAPYGMRATEPEEFERLAEIIESHADRFEANPSEYQTIGDLYTEEELDFVVEFTENF